MHPTQLASAPKQEHVFCHSSLQSTQIFLTTAQSLNWRVLSRPHAWPVTGGQVVPHAPMRTLCTKVVALHSRPILVTARGPQLHSRWRPVKLHQGQQDCAGWAHLRVKHSHPPLCLADNDVYACQQLCHQEQQAATSLPSPGSQQRWLVGGCNHVDEFARACTPSTDLQRGRESPPRSSGGGAESNIPAPQR